jgi:diguanylate cyclase (GGDEF)-like protein
VQLVRGSSAREDPLSREALFRQVVTLVGAVMLGFLSMALRETDGTNTGVLVFASIATAVTVIATMLVPWHRLHHAFHTVVPIVFLVVAYLARHATGGADSAYAQLALLPVFCVAVYGNRIELAGMVFAAGAVLVAPLVGNGLVDQAWVQALASLVGGSAVAFVIHRFLGQLRHQANRLQVVAGTDSLTGAANRRAWDEELSMSLVRAARAGMPLSIALLDVDRFKEFNDRHGHQAGDRLLKEAAAAWRGILRATDVLARIGGDEFAVLLPGCALDMAATIAEHLRSAVPSSAGCSVGVAAWDGSESSLGLVARADRALYDAKERGRDRVVITSDDGVRIELANGIPRAYRVQRDEPAAKRESPAPKHRAL